MSQTSTSRTAACAAAAPLLPLAGHNLLNASEEAQLREHLATCASCRAELALYTRVEAAWQRAFAADQVGESMISQQELLADINNESVAITTRPAQSAESASPPDHPTAPRNRPRRFVAGVSALAAVLLIAVIVGAAFLARAHNPVGAGPRATATAKAQPAYQNISDSQFTDISMVSDTEGWAIGGSYVAVYTQTGNPSTLYEKPLLWHYLNGKWSPVQLSIHGQLKSISMDSKTDGWAIGLNAYDQAQEQIILLHYDGHTWKEESSKGAQGGMEQVQMLSPTDGWIVGVASPSSPSTSPSSQGSGIWHYDGHTWKALPLPTSLNELIQEGDLLQISSISMISSTEGWAAATLTPGEQIPPSPTPIPTVEPNSLSPSGVILHYTGGQWEVQQILPQTYLHTISMLSSSNGWLAGQNDTRSITADPNSPGGVQQDKTSPLLLYYAEGQWVILNSSVNANPSTIDTFLELFMRSASDGWMTFLPANLPNDTPTLLHFNGRQWNLVHLPTIKNTGIYYVSGVFTTSPTEGWAIGSREVTGSSVYTYLRVPVIYHLHNGVWSVAQS